MENVFTNGSEIDDRDILIKIDSETIYFYFYRQYIGHREWVREQEENDNYLDEDEKRDSEFYWIGKDQWKKDVHHWHEHMNRKSWFTPEMETFMDKNT